MFRPRSLSVILAPLMGMIVSCGGGTDAGTQASTRDFGPVLEAAVREVIVPTYRYLRDDAATLHTLVQGLQSDADLAVAQRQWLKTRRHWEQSEAFLYGPVAEKGLDPALDSWPVDRVQLDQVLASNLVLTPEAIAANLGGGLKGFHTIEYLLYGVDGKKTAAELLASPRQVAYLTATTQVLRDDAETLYLSWAEEGDDYGASFYLAGKSGGKYFASGDALQQLLTGCADIADEVANGKLADPYKEKNPELVESQFAHSSLADFADNLRSIENIYSAKGGPHSLSTLVADVDPTLDGKVRTAIADSIAAILAISPTNHPPFGRAIFDPTRAPLIEAAQATIRRLSDLLLGPVHGAILQ